MEVKYIYNENGVKETVIITLNEWLKLQKLIEEKTLIKEKILTTNDLKRFSGILKSLPIEPVKFQREIRDNEWR